MPRNQVEGGRNPRRSAERNAAQPMGGQPRSDDDDSLQKPEDIPSLLTARELQAREPAKNPRDDGTIAESQGEQPLKGRKGPARKSK